MKMVKTKQKKRSESTEVSLKDSAGKFDFKSSKKSIKHIWKDSKLAIKLKCVKSKKEKSVKSRSIGAKPKRTLHSRYQSKNFLIQVKQRKNNFLHTLKTMKTMRNASSIKIENLSLNNSLTKNRFHRRNKINFRANLNVSQSKLILLNRHKKNFSESFYFKTNLE